MKISMTLPGMDPGLSRERLFEWCRRIEAGPFEGLAFGERMAFLNPELIAMLGACAAWTTRVRLRTTIIVMPLHHPVMLAKQLASLDVLSSGRLSVGLGIGARDEDLKAVDADPSRQRNAKLAEEVALMRRIWAGETLPGMLLPIGPAPLQAGGPELLAGAMGPRAVRLAAEWADGVTGFTWAVSDEEVTPIFEQARAAWSEAGRGEPRLLTGFWYALGDGGRAQLAEHLGRYMNWLPAAEREDAQRSAGLAGSPQDLRDALRRMQDLGADEVNLVPTCGDPEEVDRAADALASF